MAYQAPHVPIELCENVIDYFCSSLDEGAEYIPNQDEAQRVGTLVACTNVHRSWAPRARFHLYHLVRVSTGSALWKLRRTLKDRDSLIPLITRLIVAPSVWDSLDGTIHDYLPIAPFLAMGSPVKQLQFTDVHWSPSLYKGLYQSGFCNRSVVRLEIVAVAFSSFYAVVPFITSFRNITHLTLAGCYFEHELTEHEMTQLQALPSSYASTSLRSLEVGGQSPAMSGVRLFGDNIEDLRLILKLGNPMTPPADHYRDCLSRYDRLRSLHLTLQPWIHSRASFPGDHEAVNVWDVIHHHVLGLLRAARSSTLCRLEIGLAPQQQDLSTNSTEPGSDAEKAPWNLPLYYGHSRHGLLNTLLTSDIQNVLATPTFSHIETLEIALCDNAFGKDQDWWSREFGERLGLRPGVLQTNLHLSTHATLWEESP